MLAPGSVRAEGAGSLAPALQHSEHTLLQHHPSLLVPGSEGVSGFWFFLCPVAKFLTKQGCEWLSQESNQTFSRAWAPGPSELLQPRAFMCQGDTS